MTRSEVEALARQAADKAERAVERGNHETARKLFDTARRFAAHARTLDVDAPLGAATPPQASPLPTGRGSVSGGWAAPNSPETP